MMNVRTPVFAANWKMYKGPAEAERFARDFASRHAPRDDATVVVFPPAISIPAFAAATAGRPDLQFGVQDVHAEAEGAHTGAISADMARSAGAAWGLAGHSERRREFGDSDAQIAAKVQRLLAAGLRPVLCIGETLEEREAGRLGPVLEKQIREALSPLDRDGRARLAYAYEPVWAIGTGRTASPDDAGEAHALVRRYISAVTGEDRDVVVLYGGSAKPGNIEELLATPGVDGVLVGGASLDPASWAAICAAAR